MNKNKKVIDVLWSQVLDSLSVIDISQNKVFGVPKGGMMASAYLKHAEVVTGPAHANIILDDIVDSGATRKMYMEAWPDKEFFAIIDKTTYPKDSERQLSWMSFPWERMHPGGEDNIKQNITRIMQFIGEDVGRSGIIETPARVVKSYAKIFSGYHIDPKSVFKVFDGEKYDEIVILKDIEFYSTCEHHMLPFYGKAHIAYIADGNIIGVSKLARLLEVFARRMQVQERIGMQVVNALDKYLKPLGAACIIEAKHMCIACRGVEKQSSAMITSSMTGRFRDDTAARMELLHLIK